MANKTSKDKSPSKGKKSKPVTKCDQSDEVVANCDRFNILKHSTSAPFAFTVFGVSMLPSVLNSQKAIVTSIRII